MICYLLQIMNVRSSTKFLITAWSDLKHGCLGQFLFLVGWSLKSLLRWSTNDLLVRNNIRGPTQNSSFHIDLDENMTSIGNFNFLLTYLKISLLKVQVQMLFNSVHMMFVRSSAKFPHLILIWLKHDPHWQFSVLVGCNLLKKSSPQKLQVIMIFYFIEVMWRRSSTEILHFVLIIKKSWPPLAILVSDWLRLWKKSSPMNQQVQIIFRFVQRFHISSWSSKNLDCYWQFLFLFVWNFKNLLQSCRLKWIVTQYQ